MIVEVADHPFILLGELIVCLPEAVAVWALESTFSPGSSWLEDGVVESCLDEDLVDCSMADRGGLAACVVVEVTFYSVGSPESFSSEM